MGARRIGKRWVEGVAFMGARGGVLVRRVGCGGIRLGLWREGCGHEGRVVQAKGGLRGEDTAWWGWIMGSGVDGWVGLWNLVLVEPL